MRIPSFRTFVAVVCAVLVIVVVNAESSSSSTYTVEWKIGKYEPITLDVGDSIQFVNKGFHNVEIMPSFNDFEDCAFADATLLEDPQQIYTNDGTPEEVFFACSIGFHCASGQKVKVTFVDVTDTDTDADVDTDTDTDTDTESEEPVEEEPPATGLDDVSSSTSRFSPTNQRTDLAVGMAGMVVAGIMAVV